MFIVNNRKKKTGKLNKKVSLNIFTWQSEIVQSLVNPQFKVLSENNHRDGGYIK